MNQQDQDWKDDVLQAVRQEYPDARTLFSGETTGNLIIEIAPGRVFKVLSPARTEFEAEEQALCAALSQACGDEYTSLFVPQRVAMIGGQRGFESPRFNSTLLDVILDPQLRIEELASRVRAGLDATLAHLGALRQRTLGPVNEQFIEEMRLTCKYIADGFPQGQSSRLDLLRRLATQADRFMPAESCWRHGDLHLDNIALFDGAWRLFDPIPTLHQSTEYVDRIRHLEPPVKGHVLLDYAKLLISLEREAGKLDYANRDESEIRDDRRALLDRAAQIERRNLLLRLRREYEKRAIAEVGSSALHLGYTIYYGLYTLCDCKPCNIWGIKETMRLGLERAINQLLADDLAHRLADARIATPIPGGTQQCLLYELPLNGRRAVLKIETAASTAAPFTDSTSDEVTRNLAGYRTMPRALRPTIFATGEYERLPFLLMQHAGMSLRERLIAPYDATLLDALVGQLREAYTASAIRDPEQSRQCYTHVLDLFETNITDHIARKHSFETSAAVEAIAALRRAPTRALPDWCIWTTTDFTVDNLFIADGRFLFIDPKESLAGLFEIDLGMFPTLIGIYSRSARDGLPPIDRSNVAPYRERLFQLAASLRADMGETVKCQPFLTLGEAWQCILSCRFREGDEAKRLYDDAVIKLELTCEELNKRNEVNENNE